MTTACRALTRILAHPGGVALACCEPLVGTRGRRMVLEPVLMILGSCRGKPVVPVRPLAASSNLVPDSALTYRQTAYTENVHAETQKKSERSEVHCFRGSYTENRT